MFRGFILDAGHGHNTLGKRSNLLDRYGKSALIENEFNEAIVNKVSAFLMLRQVPHEILATLWHDEPLSDRVDSANKMPKDYLLVSIHADFSASPDASGATVFHHPKSALGKVVATKLYDILKIRGFGNGNRRSPVQGANFKILRETKQVSILVESGFMSSEVDIKNLTDNEWRNLFAYTLAQFMEGVWTH